MRFRLFMARLMYAATGINLMMGVVNYSLGAYEIACFNASVGLVAYLSYIANRRLYDRMVQDQKKTNR